jgi:threonine aldolase
MPDNPGRPANPTLRWLEVRRRCERILSGTRPTTMRERLATLAEAEGVDGWPDFYGDGPVAALERRVAGLLGTEAAVFFPTGTMAQQVALRHWAERTGSPAVAMHPRGHLEEHEGHAYAQPGGLRAVWSTASRRHPTPDEIAALEPFGTLVLELPLRDTGFVLPSWDELTAAATAARARGARVHLDGARLWESTPHLGRSLAEVAARVDSVYVSFYKSLGGLSGAALAGDAELASHARAWRHRYGGQLFQQWPATLAAAAGLDRELPRLAEYVAHARTVAAALADALGDVPGARVFPDPPHTHQFQLWLPYAAEALNAAAVAMGESESVWFAAGWRDGAAPGVAMTEVTVAAPALEWSVEDVAAATKRFLARLTDPSGARPGNAADGSTSLQT